AGPPGRAPHRGDRHPPGGRRHHRLALHRRLAAIDLPSADHTDARAQRPRGGRGPRPLHRGAPRARGSVPAGPRDRLRPPQPHRDEDVHFVLLGYGEAAALEEVTEQAHAHGVAHRVHLIGAVAPDEVSRALADGDVAVVHELPICLSYRYALPNKLFESIRAGLPIAAADLPDMKAVVEEL